MEKKRSGKGRKGRTKAKKPKFLSLRLQFPANESEKIKRSSEVSNSKQLDLFPLPPEIDQVEDRDSNDHENDVAFFFSAADGGATSLTGLLDTAAGAGAASNSSHIYNNSRLDDLSPSSASLSYAYGGQDSEDRAALVRNALRNRERDSSEEKWVCYSEVVKRKVKEEEVTSSAVDRAALIQRPSLKLDYQEIMNAWSNKGPLYIDPESSQVVPDMNDDFLSHEGSNNGTMNWGSNVGVWTVPETIGEIENGEMRMKREDELKMGQREASVLRYKEKRQNRLFSRTIRYQVRKLNAEKRPRLKGRFVKRN